MGVGATHPTRPDRSQAARLTGARAHPLLG